MTEPTIIVLPDRIIVTWKGEGGRRGRFLIFKGDFRKAWMEIFTAQAAAVLFSLDETPTVNESVTVDYTEVDDFKLTGE